ncbi:hypothetical protein CGRA01v4_12207 [Colletotrichum graminicola]|uniref:Uncharacterized protein n=1 Tax=Colletotrichum graminicola (strain M1.001 / M2 / FGSC 10212) TaxID=645133 RepID=E3QZR6_COLGM|nr:uncharacterized protein GLRG_11499 [Colletotrichum graminicola M1.001]EFQ36354.1 hypothetical protein GLRG_11499 [Colletotrichum graminicola M1.001]WDK20918.1 hypothetical protein CGRA01v4_12207 [Colletotrichum graminicola]
MHSVDERILATWQVDSLEAILGRNLSPRTWSQQLRKRLLALSRLVSLQEARELLRQELASRLNDPARNRTAQRKHLCDIDVLHVVNAQQKENPRPELLDEDEQLDPITVAPVSTRSTRRKRVRSQSPDQVDARPPLRSRSPDLSTPFTLGRPPGRTARDDYPLQLLARTAADSKPPFVPILPRTHRPMRVPPVTYRHGPTADHGKHTDTIVVEPNSPENPSPQSRKEVAIPPRDGPSPRPTPETGDADELANDDTTTNDAANDSANNEIAGADVTENDMASDDGANEGTANGGMSDDGANGDMTNGSNDTDVKMVDTVSVQDTPRPQTAISSAPKTPNSYVDTVFVPFEDETDTTTADATLSREIPRPKTANPRVENVFARLKNEREYEIADLEGEVQKLRFEVDVKRTQIQLYRHNHTQARRRAERTRGSLNDLVAEEEESGQVGEYDEALAEITAFGERYSSILDATGEENLGDQRRQIPRTPAKRISSKMSSRGTPGLQDVSETPKVLLTSLHAAIKMQKALQIERKTALQEARVAAEQEVKDAEAAVVERLAEAEEAEASVTSLLGTLQSLENYLNSVKEQAVLLDKMGAC